MADNIHDTQPGKKRGRVGDPIQVKFTSGDEVKHLLVPAGADDSQVWQSINNGTDKPAIPMRFTSGEEAKNIFVPSGAGEAQLGEAIRNGHPVAKAPAVSAPPPPPPLSYPPPIEQAHAAPQPGLWQRFKTMIGLGPERPSRSAEQVSHDLAWGHVTSQPGPQAFAQAGSDLAAWQAANPVRVEPVPYLGPNISNETRHVRLPDPHVDPRPLDLRTNYGRLPEDVGKVPSASAPAPKHPVGIVWENGLPVERELADVTRHVPLNSNPGTPPDLQTRIPLLPGVQSAEVAPNGGPVGSTPHTNIPRARPYTVPDSGTQVDIDIRGLQNVAIGEKLPGKGGMPGAASVGGAGGTFDPQKGGRH